MVTDTQTGMLLGIPRSAMCVQRFDDSRNSAIHITYRISLRSSSLREPRHPLLKVVHWFVCKGPAFLKRNAGPLSLFRLIKRVIIKLERNYRQKLGDNSFTVGGYWIGVVMILPQVHLRKPCYDFTFL